MLSLPSALLTGREVPGPCDSLPKMAGVGRSTVSRPANWWLHAPQILRANPHSCMSRSQLVDLIGEFWVDKMHVGAGLLQSSPPVEKVRQLCRWLCTATPDRLTGGNGEREGGSFFFSSFPVYAPSQLFALHDPAFVALNALEGPVHIPSSQLLSPNLNRKQPQPYADGYVVLPLASPRNRLDTPERAERAVSTVASFVNLIQFLSTILQSLPLAFPLS